MIEFDGSLTGDYGDPVLIGAGGVEFNNLLVFPKFQNLHLRSDVITQIYRRAESQFLPQVDRTGSGQPVAQNSGNQTGSQNPMDNAAAVKVFWIDAFWPTLSSLNVINYPPIYSVGAVQVLSLVCHNLKDLSIHIVISPVF